MNTKLLRRIQKRILKEPRQFAMSWLFRSQEDVTWKIPNCGTAACIAGWCGSVISGNNPKTISSIGLYGAPQASKDLKLTYAQGGRLFYLSGWPDKFRKVHQEGTAAFARQAARRIEHFIKTKGME
jgi:hypothetical protein